MNQKVANLINWTREKPARFIGLWGGLYGIIMVLAFSPPTLTPGALLTVMMVVFWLVIGAVRAFGVWKKAPHDEATRRAPAR